MQNPEPSAEEEGSNNSSPSKAKRRPLPPLPLPPKGDDQSPRMARALFDYTAKAADELTFSRGAKITVLVDEDPEDGWWKGELDGKRGLFPSNYVEFTSIHDAW